MIDDGELTALAERLVEVPGVVAVALGGSRARGDHTPDSDVDLGLYYRPPLDCTALGRLASSIGTPAGTPLGTSLGGPRAEVTEPGAWGPWVDGGGWLRISDTPVDWIYRDLDRTHRSWQDAQAGLYAWHAQAGHPLGIPDFQYAAEVGLCRVLADPGGELTALHDLARSVPPALRDALREGLWEASFILAVAGKAVRRGDTTYIAGCLFRALELCAYALHGRAGRWVVNEKGAVAAAGRLECAPRRFADRAHGVLAGLGTDPASLRHALALAESIVAETVEACRPAV
jgi:Nucleotidyltransferase domain